MPCPNGCRMVDGWDARQLAFLDTYEVSAAADGLAAIVQTVKQAVAENDAEAEKADPQVRQARGRQRRQSRSALPVSLQVLSWRGQRQCSQVSTHICLARGSCPFVSPRRGSSPSAIRPGQHIAPWLGSFANAKPNPVRLGAAGKQPRALLHVAKTDRTRRIWCCCSPSSGHVLHPNG